MIFQSYKNATKGECMEEQEAYATMLFRAPVSSDFLLAAPLPQSEFMRAEKNSSLLKSLMDYTSKGEEVEDGRFLLPSAERFDPTQFMSGSLCCVADFSSPPGISIVGEEDVIGCEHPFEYFTQMSAQRAVMSRDWWYYDITLSLGQLQLQFRRLYLPVVDVNDRISHVWMVHRFVGDPVRLISDRDAFAWS